MGERDEIISAARRFLAKCGFEEDSECWVWRGALDRKGYPNFRVGRWWCPGGVVKGHRFSLWLFRGIRATDTEQVHHLCGRTDCVNPYHLELLTDEEHQAEHPPHERDACGRFLSPYDPYEEVEVDAIW